VPSSWPAAIAAWCTVSTSEWLRKGAVSVSNCAHLEILGRRRQCERRQHEESARKARSDEEMSLPLPSHLGRALLVVLPETTMQRCWEPKERKAMKNASSERKTAFHAKRPDGHNRNLEMALHHIGAEVLHGRQDVESEPTARIATEHRTAVDDRTAGVESAAGHRQPAAAIARITQRQAGSPRVPVSAFLGLLWLA
jgi:hypothetical protein